MYGQPPKDSKPLIVKVKDKDQWSTSSNKSSKISRFSLGNAKRVQMKVAEKLGLWNCGSLPLLEISKGCVKLTFALPTGIMELIKPNRGTLSNIDTDKYLIHILDSNSARDLSISCIQVPYYPSPPKVMDNEHAKQENECHVQSAKTWVETALEQHNCY